MRFTIDAALSPAELGPIDRAQPGPISQTVRAAICAAVDGADGGAFDRRQRAADASAERPVHDGSDSITVVSADHVAQRASIGIAHDGSDAGAVEPTDADGDVGAVAGPVDAAFSVADGTPELVANSAAELAADIDAKRQHNGRAITAAVAAAYGGAQRCSVGTATAPSDGRPLG